VAEAAGKQIVRLVAKVSIAGPGGEETVKAKVDTGADRTTVDRELAAKLKLGPTGSKVRVKTLGGRQNLERPLVDAAITLKGKTFKLRVGVEDRSQMRYRVIVGRDILRSGHFLIDPSRRKKRA
jgi:hypothetical protein